MRWMTAGLALAGLMLATAATTAKAADTYGLVVGIDDYQHINPKLEGAVNDARDVADALKKDGARDVKLLLDRDASRDAIMHAWNDILTKAHKGDVLVFHYAGHGGQEPEHVKGSEPTGYDSTLLLAGFSLSGQGTYERIVDDELGWMFKRASDAGLYLLVAIDACHSGTMTRAFENPAIAKPRVRAVNYLPINPAEDRLPPFDPAWARIPDELPNVFYFGAVQDNEEVPEVEINKQWRGALSWALASGLRGGADANHDGVITVFELRDYMLDQIRMKMEGQQHPSVIPTRTRGNGDGDAPPPATGLVFTAPWLAEKMKTASKEEIAAFIQSHLQSVGQAVAAAARKGAAPVGLAIINAADADIPALAGGLTNATLADAATRPLLTWDVSGRRVLSALGDVVADFHGDDTRAFKRATAADAATTAATDRTRVQGVIDKWHLAEHLKALAEGRSLGMALQPGDSVHRIGDKVAFGIDGFKDTAFTLFDLASDGTVNLIYPLDTATMKDPPRIPAGHPYSVPLVVDTPFGADHLVAIASAEPLTELHTLLRGLDGKPAARDLEAALDRQLDGRTLQIGIHAAYTAAGKP